MIRKEKWRIYSCPQLGREASNQSTLSQGHQLPSLWLVSWVFVTTSSIYGSTSAGKRNNQDHAPLQKKNPINRPCMGDRVGVKLLCLTVSPHLPFSLSLSGPIAQFPLGKQLLAKGCSFHSHIGLFLVENLHWANSLLRQGSANTASSKPQCYKKFDGSQDARRGSPDIPNELSD